VEGVAPREAFGIALCKLGKENQNIVVLDADVSKSSRTLYFAEAFPDRFFNMGIAEQNMMGVAAGLATLGLVPFATTFAVFASKRACDQISISIAYPRLNVKVVGTYAGVTVGYDGATHQAIEDLAIMRAMPNMTVLVPADAIATERVVRAAAEYLGPVYIRLGRASVPTVYEHDLILEIGKGIVLEQGDDLTIIATGLMVAQALKARDLLMIQGISARVMDIHTLKPLDRELIIQAAKETGAIVTAEEHSIIGGLGSAVTELLGEEWPIPIVRVGIRDCFGESGNPDELLVHFGLTSEDIVRAATSVVNKRDSFNRTR
jgi:transketolase